LWGERSKFAQNFELDYGMGSDTPLNLGDIIPLSGAISTYMLSAGTPIVLRQLFNDEFKLITPMVIDNEKTFGNTTLYGTAAYPLTSYPLSAYSPSWGWGIDLGGVELGSYYDFYDYNLSYNNKQLEGVLDWTDDTWNIESLSSTKDWSGNYGMLENMIDHTLRKGAYAFEDKLDGSIMPEAQIDISNLITSIPVYKVSIDRQLNGITLNGQYRPQIYLKRGATVRFETDDTTMGEPFRIFKYPNDELWTAGVALEYNAEGNKARWCSLHRSKHLHYCIMAH
jgi:hypothetical protein